jgi:hypothetical protein
MKKILFFALLLIMSKGAYAQSASMTIDNSLNPCDVHMIIYAQCASIGATGCNDIESNGFTISGYSTLTYSSVAAFQFGIGWVSSYTFGTLTPSDYQWTQVTFDYVTCPCLPGKPKFAGLVEDAGITCNPGYSAYTSCLLSSCSCTIPGYVSSSYGQWSPATGTSLSNVTITYQ